MNFIFKKTSAYSHFDISYSTGRLRIYFMRTKFIIKFKSECGCISDGMYVLYNATTVTVLLRKMRCARGMLR